MSKNKNTAAYFLRIAGVLTLICSVIALMLAVVNAVTKDTIAENTQKEKVEAISRIFGDVDDVETNTVEDHEINFVFCKDMLVGYTVTVKPQGYGGEIEMLVGIERGGSVQGIEIINMSETPGVGSRVKSDPGFLPQFKGMTGKLTVGDNVDAISGASISSKAVTAGGNEALSIEVDVSEYEKGASPATEKDTEQPTESAAEPETQTEQPMETAEDTHIDAALVGQGDQPWEYRPSDNVVVAVRDTTYYLEHETTDTESVSEDA